jgi:putative chitinase
MQITKELLILGTGASPVLADKWLVAIQSACDKFEINRPNRIAAFLANIGVESGGLSAVVENLNYDAAGLARTWKGRYAVDPNAKVKLPNAKALALHRRPEAIANDTYANRMGNGSPASGDGWKFRGRGLLQNTGRDKYKECGVAIGMDLIANPDLLMEPEAAAMSAAWFFSKHGCNERADRNEISRIVEVINGALPNEANHGTLRLTRYNAVRRNLV